MELLKVIVHFVGDLLLGVIQGLTETFPVSSSAHLALTGALLHITLGTTSVSLEKVIYLHLGTWFAILIYYWHDTADIVRSFARALAGGGGLEPQASRGAGIYHNPKTPFHMLLCLAVTTILGLFLKRFTEQAFDRILPITLLMIINGIIILAVAPFASGDKRVDQLGLADYLLIGVAQGIAVFPGISRLGLTLCVGLLCRLNWFEALKLAFLLSLPSVLGASALEVAENYVAGRALGPTVGLSTLAGVVAAAITGYLAIHLLAAESLRNRFKLVYFGYYCIVVGLFFFVFFKYLGCDAGVCMGASQ